MVCMHNGLPRILVVELGGLVDLCATVPCLHLLREAQPNAQLDVLTRAPGRELLRDQPLLDRVFEIGSSEGSGLKAVRYWADMIREARYDVLIDLSGSIFSGAIAWRSRAPERYGFTGLRSSFGVPRAYTHPFRPGDEVINRADMNLRLCGVYCGISRPSEYGLVADSEDAEETDRFFEEAIEGGKTVLGISFETTGAAGEMLVYAGLVNRMARDGRFDVTLIPHRPRTPVILPGVSPGECGAIEVPVYDSLSSALPVFDHVEFVVTNSLFIGWLSRLQGLGIIAFGASRDWQSSGPLGVDGMVDGGLDTDSAIDGLEEAVLKYARAFAVA